MTEAEAKEIVARYENLLEYVVGADEAGLYEHPIEVEGSSIFAWRTRKLNSSFIDHPCRRRVD